MNVWANSWTNQPIDDQHLQESMAVKSKKRDDERYLLPEGLLPSGIQQGKLKIDISVSQEEIQAAATLTTPTEWSERAQKSWKWRRDSTWPLSIPICAPIGQSSWCMRVRCGCGVRVVCAGVSNVIFLYNLILYYDVIRSKCLYDVISSCMIPLDFEQGAIKFDLSPYQRGLKVWLPLWILKFFWKVRSN